MSVWPSDGFRSKGHDLEQGDFKVRHEGVYGTMTEYVVREAALQQFLDGCFGRLDGGQMYLFNFYIPPYAFATADAPDPRRTRKLLLNRKEIDKLSGRLQTKGLTLVPLEVYFKRGWAKVSIALAKGKRGPDKRDSIRKKDAARDMERSFKGKFKL